VIGQPPKYLDTGFYPPCGKIPPPPPFMKGGNKTAKIDVRVHSVADSMRYVACGQRPGHRAPAS
jgi:hypothetical protein